MKPTTGLRTEIIVNLLLLMGAALFFVSLLLLRFAEEELLAQRVNGMTGVLGGVAAALAAVEGRGEDAEEPALRARRLLEQLARHEPNLAWTLVDPQLQPLASGGEAEAPPPVMEDLARAALMSEGVLRVHYQSVLLPWADHSAGMLRYSLPLGSREHPQGVLQIRLSLTDLSGRLIAVRSLTLSCVVLYGLVLVLFGGYLLGSTVVRPVRRLAEQAGVVAQGDLSRTVPVEGPREIAELAGSFNAMTAGLRASREQTEATIASLHAANEELRRTQEALVRSGKLATVGHLAAGMAHELGNPLAAVLGYLELLRADLPAGAQREMAAHALKEVGRMDALVRELLDYAAPSRGLVERFDPLATLREALALLEHQGRLGERVVCTAGLPPELPAVLGVRAKLLQVFVNLLLNALDAGGPGQALTLTAGSSGSEVRLAVRDDGAGIAPQILGHIFDPFYTTKAPGRGRGLGLAVCQRVVTEMGGRIEVESTPGRGSCFTVRLQQARGEHDD